MNMYEQAVYDDLEYQTDEDSAFSVEEYKCLAKTYLDLFFKDKLKDGKKIPKTILHSDRNICLVLNLDICEGMPVIYDSLKPKFKSGKKVKVSEDVQFILYLLRECAKLAIPKCFFAGLIAVFVETCKDCKIDI